MMKKITSTIFGMLLTISLVACDNPAKTSNSAPNSNDAQNASTEKSGAQANQNDTTNEIRRKQVESDNRSREQRNVTGGTVVKTDTDNEMRRKQLESDNRSREQRNITGDTVVKTDTNNQIRANQLESDIRSREQRNNIAGDTMVRADNDLKSEVRSKLEANLPASALAIDAKNGAVTVTGSVVNEAQLQKIEPLAKEIKGVKSVMVKATVSTTKPEPAKPDS